MGEKILDLFFGKFTRGAIATYIYKYQRVIEFYNILYNGILIFSFQFILVTFGFIIFISTNVGYSLKPFLFFFIILSVILAYYIRKYAENIDYAKKKEAEVTALKIQWGAELRKYSNKNVFIGVAKFPLQIVVVVFLEYILRTFVFHH